MIEEKRIILKNAGRTDPAKITDYISSGGYKSAEKALKMEPSEIIDSITKAGLRGRSGTGFPTGIKLRYLSQVHSSSGVKYLVCNTDEGEPGTSKDSFIIENDPHLVLEGMIIAAHAIGAQKAYICLPGDYFKSNGLIEKAIADATEHGFLGADIFGSAGSLTVEIRNLPGSFLCGEDLTMASAYDLVNDNNRLKAPFTSEKELLRDPAFSNNVETLANLPTIINNGPKWYSSLGLKGSSGTKVITVSGDVVNPGYFEIEFGMSLREIIFGLAGGMEGRKRFKAVITGGPSGTFLDESSLDTVFSWEPLIEAGAIMGSGSVVVLNEERYIPEITLSILRYFSNETCGKCVSCRVGNKALSDRLDEMITSSGKNGFGLDRLLMEAQYMLKTSLCPLGQSPVIPLQSLKRYFENEFRFDNKV